MVKIDKNWKVFSTDSSNELLYEKVNLRFSSKQTLYKIDDDNEGGADLFCNETTSLIEAKESLNSIKACDVVEQFEVAEEKVNIECKKYLVFGTVCTSSKCSIRRIINDRLRENFYKSPITENEAINNIYKHSFINKCKKDIEIKFLHSSQIIF